MNEDSSVFGSTSPVEYRLAVLRDLFPEAFKDGQFSVQALTEFIGDPAQTSDEDSSSGLSWPGRTEAVQSLRQNAVSALEPEEGFVGGGSHVFVTGESYEVMKLLQPAYRAGIKMAFVDPPYNNGNDEIYCDDLVEPWGRYESHLAAVGAQEKSPAMLATSGRGTHSRWMSMMLPRLYVVRNLLADNGVVFVVIDDHESHRLRFVMDEVFGPENFVCTFVWEKKHSPAPDAQDVGYVHEYILCYRKSSSFEAAFLPMTDDQRGRYQNPDNDPRGPWKATDYTCRFTADERKNLYYPILHPGTGQEVLPNRARVWACTREEHERHVREGRIWWGRNNEATKPARKAYLSEIRQGRMPATLLKHDEVGRTDEAAKELRRFFPDLKANSKPVALLRRLITISGAESGDIILDVFAGIGTTAEAVIKHNIEEDSDLRFLLIGLPELVQGGGSATTLPEVALHRARVCLEEAGKSSQRLRTFRQRGPVFYLRGQPTHTATDYFDAGASDETLACNIAIAAGFAIDGPIERRELTGQAVAYVFSGEVAVCVSRNLNESAIESLGELKVSHVACLEAGFGAQDGLLGNARLELEQRGISFETI
jgi:adenine-specific DNA-methyltransferase